MRSVRPPRLLHPACLASLPCLPVPPVLPTDPLFPPLPSPSRSTGRLDELKARYVAAGQPTHPDWDSLLEGL